MIATQNVAELLAESRRQYRERHYPAAHEALCRALELQPGHPAARDGLRIIENAMRRSGEPIPWRPDAPAAAPAPSAGSRAAAAAGESDPANADLVAELRAWQAARGIRPTSAPGAAPAPGAEPDDSPAGVRYIAKLNMAGAGVGIALTLIGMFTTGMLPSSGPFAWLLAAGVFVMSLFYGNLLIGLSQLGIGQTTSTMVGGPIPVNNLGFLVGLVALLLFAAQFQLFRRLREGSRTAYLGVLIPSALALLASLPVHAKMLQAAGQLVQYGLPAWFPVLMVLWLGQVGFTVLYLALSRKARDYFAPDAGN